MLFRAGVPRHAIIKKFAGEDISSVDDFISVLSKLSRGARVPLEYISHTDRHRRKVDVTSLEVEFEIICMSFGDYWTNLFGFVYHTVLYFSLRVELSILGM